MGLRHDGGRVVYLAVGLWSSLGVWAALVLQRTAAEGHRGSAEGRVLRLRWKPNEIDSDRGEEKRRRQHETITIQG